MLDRWEDYWKIYNSSDTRMSYWEVNSNGDMYLHYSDGFKYCKVDGQERMTKGFYRPIPSLSFKIEDVCDCNWEKVTITSEGVILDNSKQRLFYGSIWRSLIFATHNVLDVERCPFCGQWLFSPKYEITAEW